MPEEIIIYTDGGSRGNPGPAAAGFILKDKNGNQLLARGLFLGETTNNFAEYTAIVKSLEAAKQLDAAKVTIFSDSELLVRQLNGQYKVKSDSLRPLFQQALKLLNSFEDWKVEHITREKNQQADELANQAMNLEQDVEAEPQQNAQTKKPIRLGILISGGGRTMMNILEQINQGKLNAQIAVVISSLSNVAGVEKAKAAGLDVKIVRKKDFADIDQFSRRLEEELVAANVDLVIQGGWLCLWKIPERYVGRVMNIHPALLPSFGGQGMWGHHVHEAVLTAGCRVSGCTVHFCTNEYDKGSIIIQRTCPVRDDDTADTLAERVFQQECIAYPQAIKLFAENRIIVENGKVKIKNEACCAG